MVESLTKKQERKMRREENRLFQQEKVVLDATELICRLVDEQGVSRRTLAKRIEKTRSYISQILDGSSELTIRMFSDILVALGYTLRFEAVKRKIK